MTEQKLVAACLKVLRVGLPGYIVTKHADSMTSGWPDVSIAGRGIISLWEFKHGPAVKWAHGLQQLTCRRLSAAGIPCHVVLYEEQAQTRSTLIMTPDEQLLYDTLGFDHRFVLDYVRRIHAQ